jgi:multicomponent Na+:H+ antiporter subunit E
MSNLAGFGVVFTAMLLFWMLLAGFTFEELIAGTITSSFVAIMTSTFFRPRRKNYLRSLACLIYVIPFYIRCQVISHIEVIKLIVTGRIKPGIMEFKHSHSTDFGVTALANSITMTPGTLTLEARDDSLFVHWIKVKPDRESISGVSKKLLKIWD